MTGGLVGLAITYALQLTDKMAFFVRNLSDLENNTIAVERIKEYTSTPSEASNREKTFIGAIIGNAYYRLKLQFSMANLMAIKQHTIIMNTIHKRVRALNLTPTNVAQ